MSADWDLPVSDFFELLDLGLARGRNVLTAGELIILRRMRGLTGEPARLYARLSGRKRWTFAVDRLDLPGVHDLHEAMATLVELGLMTGFVPWPRRLEVLTVEELKAACRNLKLRVGGRRELLVSRVEGHRVGRERKVMALCHRRLIRRLERFALGSLRADRSQWVIERMGMVRWPEYTRTQGSALFPGRRELLRWEGILAGEHSAEQALSLLEDPSSVWPPAGLDPRRRLRRAVLDVAREVERQGDFTRAECLYRRLAPVVGPGRVAVRLARVLELDGRGEDGLQVLVSSRSVARLSERIGMNRSGRRLAKRLRRAWAPSRPLASPRERRMRMERVGTDRGRPIWDDGETVEAAVMTRLLAAGRRPLLAEGPLWRTLFALLFAETYFMPVAGQLPVPFLAGPLDLGTPAFRERRGSAVQAVLDGVAAGEAGERVRVAVAKWWGVRLSGARWDRATADELVHLAQGFSPDALVVLLDQLLTHGLRSAAGLPDLVVLSGAAVRLDGAHPTRFPASVVLVEVKGPTDTLRDEQIAWNHRLVEAGAVVEVWKVGS